MKATTANGLVFHVEDEGPPDGQALVFSNSLGTDLRVWQPLLPLLPKCIRAIRHDKRGHGLSACPDGPYSIDDHTLDLAGLLDRIGVRNAIVVGLSPGSVRRAGPVHSAWPS